MIFIRDRLQTIAYFKPKRLNFRQNNLKFKFIVYYVLDFFKLAE